MKKILKNKFLIYILCLLIAGAFSFVALPALTASEADLTTVVRVKADVQPGTLITADMVTAETVGAYGLDSAALVNTADVVGRYAIVTIYAGDNLTAKKLSAESPIRAEANQRYITLSLASAAAGGGGYIKAGALVDVMAYDDSGEVPVTSSIPGVVVYSIKNAALQDVDQLQPGSGDTIPAYVTLIATPEQARELVKQEYGEQVHLVLRPDEMGG